MPLLAEVSPSTYEPYRASLSAPARGETAGGQETGGEEGGAEGGGAPEVGLPMVWLLLNASSADALQASHTARAAHTAVAHSQSCLLCDQAAHTARVGAVLRRVALAMRGDAPPLGRRTFF